MSEYRPYYDAESFRYPSGPGETAANASTSDAFEFIDLDDFVGSQSQLSAVGVSVGRFYARMLISQPFDVAKFLLQVGDWDGRAADYAEDPEDGEYGAADAAASSDEEVDYFIDVRDTHTGETQRESAKEPRRRVAPSRQRGLQVYRPSADALFPEAVEPASGPYVLSMLGAVSDKEGVLGMWRAINAACLCRAATGVVEAWLTSFLASVTDTPDPQFVNVLHAVDPVRLLAVGAGGCAAAALVLTPLYMIRARLVATSFAATDRPRSLRWSLQQMVRAGQFVAPWWVALPTTLAAVVNSVFTRGAPLVLSRWLGADVFAAPRWFQFSQLVAGLAGLVVKIPLETLANRAQLRAVHAPARSLIVRPTPYPGMLPSLWAVASGHVGVATFYRGWRSEVVGVIGEWGYTALDEDRRPADKEQF